KNGGRPAWPPAGAPERVTKPHTLEDRARRRRCLSGRPPADGGGRGPNTQAGLEGSNDARTGMPPGMPGGAMCVQRFDDSLNSAIHITYRISLRSSSMPEPRDPLLKVLFFDFSFSLVRDCSDCKRERKEERGVGPAIPERGGGVPFRSLKRSRLGVSGGRWPGGREGSPRRPPGRRARRSNGLKVYTGLARCGGSGLPNPRASRLVLMILPQVHLRKPCYDFYFL